MTDSEELQRSVKDECLTAVMMPVVVCLVMPCGLVHRYQRFKGKYSFHLQA
jgi:hypothetical protein